MKTIVQIQYYSGMTDRKGMTPWLTKKLDGFQFDFTMLDRVSCHIVDNDELVTEIDSHLKKAGIPRKLPPALGSYLGKDINIYKEHYSIKKRRVWDELDFQDASYILVEGISGWSEPTFMGDTNINIVYIAKDMATPEKKYWQLLNTGTFCRGITVSEKLRDGLDILGCKGICWLPMVPIKIVRNKTVPTEWPKRLPVHVGLHSMIELPPVAPSMLRVPYQRMKKDITPSIISLYDRSDYSDVQLHYLRSDIERVGAFDVARTLEGGGGFHNRYTVISRRVYEYLKTQNVHATYVPVVIEEG